MSPTVSSDSPRPPTSRLLHTIDRITAHAWVAGLVVVISILWIIGSAVSGFPSRVETAFQTLVATVTLTMVFVIQHTQTREQLVTQRKLDELLRAAPHADNALIALEEAGDDELSSTHDQHRDLRAQARDTT